MKPSDLVAQRFRIDRKVGRGGMGTVYQATDQTDGALAAVKVMNAPDEDDAKRFVREARALAQLSHPAIVGYRAHGVTEEGDLFLAMEWVQGEDLYGCLRERSLDVAQTVRLAARLASALAHAHDAGIVHRDVKPANVILPDGDPSRAKLVDFGIARFSQSVHQLTALTMQGALVGTPGYVAPEQIRGHAVDGRADVFSLGCILFECLVGDRPFPGTDFMAVLGKILFDPVARVNEARAEPIVAALDDLVAGMLQKPADARPGSMRDVLQRLEGLTEPAGARPSTPTPRDRFLTGQEQRLVGVVAAAASSDDISGTEQTMMPVELDEHRAALLAQARRFGAQLEVLPDGSVLAIVAAAAAPTDLATRTARLSLALHATLGGPPIAVVMGRGVVSDRIPVGEGLDRAARMLRGARRGIHLDSDTAELLGERFEVARGGESPMLVRERDVALAGRTLLGKVTRCVGRRKELRLIEGAFEEVVEDSVAKVVLVTGEAGMGKTRLLTESVSALLHARALRLVTARADELRAGSAFAMIAPALRAAAAIREGDGPATCRTKIHAMVAQAGVPSDARERVAVFLGELAGVPFPDDGNPQLRAARTDPMLMSDQIRAAFVDWLRAECTGRPVLLVLEDLHWGDLPTVQLVDEALRVLCDEALLVLALARPVVDETFPRLWHERDITRLTLGKLGKKAAVTLVREVLGDGIDDAGVDAIVQRADGNAFFLEELIRATAEGRAGDRLPDTVLGTIEARLRELDGDARLVLRAASIYGEACWPGAVRALLEGRHDVDGWLAALAAQELFDVAAATRFDGETEYHFRHALVRDACHAMLTDTDLSRGHRRAAEWLEHAGETDAVVLAEHWERGGDGERAAEQYLTASRDALDGNDLAGAQKLATHGRRLSTDAGLRLQLHFRLAEALLWDAKPERGQEIALSALPTLSPGSKDWCAAAILVCEAAPNVGRVDEVHALRRTLTSMGMDQVEDPDAWVKAIALAVHAYSSLGRLDDAAELLRHVPDDGVQPLTLARLLQARAVVCGSSGDLGAAIRLGHESARAFETAGATRHAVMQHLYASALLAELGAAQEALDVVQRARQTALAAGMTYNAAYAHYVVGATQLRAGSYEEAARTLRSVVQEQVHMSDVRLASCARYELALALRALRSNEEAEKEAIGSVEGLREMPAHLASALGVLGAIRLDQGDVSGGLEATTRGMEALHVAEGGDYEALLRLTHARALIASNRLEEAAAVLRAATARLEQRAAAIEDAPLRAAFLTRIPTHADTFELGRLLR